MNNIFILSRENYLKKPWYHLKNDDYHQLFCPEKFEELFPNIKLKPGQSVEAQISITVKEKQMAKSFEESLVYGFGGNWTILKTKEEFKYIQNLIQTNEKTCGWNTIKLKDGIYFPCLFKPLFDCDENGPSIGYEYVNLTDAEQLIFIDKKLVEERKKQFDKNHPDGDMEW